MMDDQSPTQTQMFYYILDTQFSIYVAMESCLKARGCWKQLTNVKSTRYNLLLGDRFSVNYTLAKEGHLKLINYFKGSHLLTLKSAMAKLLPRYPDVLWLPETYVLAGGGNPNVAERELFVERMTTCTASNDNKVWIVKPSAGCKGEGIVMDTSLENILQFVDSAGPKASFVVQEYIKNPMLIGGRKFDIRQWVLLTANYEVYIFPQGSLRTCSVPYVPWTSGSDPLAHLTNHCLQATGPDFGKYEEGNEMWYDEFEKYLQENGIGVSFRRDLLPQMEAIVKECFLAAKDILQLPPGSPGQCFQLFGFDFMVDATMKVLLIEINGSPASAEKWQGPLVEGIVQTVVDPLYPPPLNKGVGVLEDHLRWYRIY
eukprot:PhF_6_TR32406/c0_g1_i1/m.48078/K06047/TTL; tubulin---tyrosine ligase